MTLLILSVLSSIAAFYCLFRAWRDDQRGPIWLGSMSVLLAITGYLLITEFGPEFGWSYLLMFTPCAALIWAASHAQIRKRPAQPQVNPDWLSKPSLKSLRHVGHFIMVMVVAPLASLMVGVYACRLVLEEELSQLAAMVMVLPFLWATVAYLYLMLSGKIKAGFAVAMTGLSGLLIVSIL